MHSYTLVHDVEARDRCLVFSFIALYIRSLREHVGHWFSKLQMPVCLGYPRIRIPPTYHHAWLLCGCRGSHLGLKACTACIVLTESPAPLAQVFAFLKRTLAFVFFSAISLLWENNKRSPLTQTQSLFSLPLLLSESNYIPSLINSTPEMSLLFWKQHHCGISHLLSLLLGWLLFSPFISHH